MIVYKNAKINDRITDFGIVDGKFAFFHKTMREGIDLQGKEVIPGLIDIHSHGCMGFDVMDGSEHLEEMSRFYLKNGVTAWYPTTMSMAKDVIAKATAVLPETTGAKALGYHLEGPFINVDCKGAQAASAIENAVWSDLASYHNLGLITVAPEREGAMEMIENATVPVCLGHTAADYDVASAAFTAGAVCLTHTFNAMNGIHHRNPGPIGAAVAHDAYAQIISDGFHLHPSVVRMLCRAFGPEKAILISDSMRATGLEDGTYDLGGQAVTVQNGVARLADGTLAGSTATLLDCVKKAIEFGVPKQDAIAMASAAPAEMMGLNKGRLKPGYDADFVIMDEEFHPVAASLGGDLQILVEGAVPDLEDKPTETQA